MQLWAEPVGTRVAEGEAVQNVQVISANMSEAVLLCEDNQSKFRVGDRLRLNRGDPQNNYFCCEITEEQGNYWRVSRGYNTTFIGVSGNGWVLDKDIVDVRHLIIGLLETIGSNPQWRDYFYRLLSGKIEPQFDLQSLERATGLAGGWGFNPSQTDAFARAYATQNYYLIQGPPGTGKTWVLAYLAAQLASEGQRVLVTAFTHRAINNALVKIARHTGYPRLAKIGQVANADDLVQGDIKVENYEKFVNSPYAFNNKGTILGGTCFAVRTSRLQDVDFDTVIFDEAGQMILPLALSGMMAAKKAIFIGDHMQMGPIITTEHRAAWVTKSIFETLFTHFPGTMLDITYRMNRAINAFPNKQFYGGRLKPHPGNANKTLQLSRPAVKYASVLDASKPDIFIRVDHSNRGMRSKEEAQIAAEITAEAIRCGVPAREIAIIAPYRAQGRLIRSELNKLLEQDEMDDLVVDTVERVQGQERDMIIVSLTTSDPGHAAQRAAFYFQPNRLNVAITRPRVKRIVIGSPLLFKSQPEDPMHQRWVRIFENLYKQAHVISGNGFLT